MAKFYFKKLKVLPEQSTNMFVTETKKLNIFWKFADSSEGSLHFFIMSNVLNYL